MLLLVCGNGDRKSAMLGAESAGFRLRKAATYRRDGLVDLSDVFLRDTDDVGQQVAAEREKNESVRRSTAKTSEKRVKTSEMANCRVSGCSGK